MVTIIEQTMITKSNHYVDLDHFEKLIPGYNFFIYGK